MTSCLRLRVLYKQRELNKAQIKELEADPKATNKTASLNKLITATYQQLQQLANSQTTFDITDNASWMINNLGNTNAIILKRSTNSDKIDSAYVLAIQKTSMNAATRLRH